MSLLILLVLYGVTFVNYLLKAFASSMSVMTVSFKVNAFVFCVGGLLLDSFAMVPHRECGLCW